MGKIVLINTTYHDQTVDTVDNAANSGLWAGGSTCCIISKKSGIAALTAAYVRYQTPLTDDSAVITPTFNVTNTKYIIHASAPILAGS